MSQISIGGQTVEVYGDGNEAASYFAQTTTGAAWTGLSSDLRNRALVQATRSFDRTGWQGAPTQPRSKTQPQPVGTQPLAWPRTGLVDSEGEPLDSSAIPDQVLYGNFELALFLATDETANQADGRGSNVKVDKLTQRVEGAVTQTREQQFFTRTLGKLTEWPEPVLGYIGLWLEGSALGGLVVASGADRESAFDDGQLNYEQSIPGLT